jgi:hypothetical protein
LSAAKHIATRLHVSIDNDSFLAALVPKSQASIRQPDPRLRDGFDATLPIDGSRVTRWPARM